MLSRLFGKSLPGPTPNQDATNLEPFPLGNDAEITAAAYEPRFCLFAFGNAEGRLFVMNKRSAIIASNVTTNSPICELKSCPNSSSFVSLCSQFSLDHHPSLLAPMSPDSNKPTLLSKRDKVKTTIIAHWVVTPEKAVPRIVSLKEDVISLAISPSTPNFALNLQANGSVLGFSLEKMKFTELYINQFEKKPCRAISCSRGMTYFIAHEKIETVDISSLELDSYSSLKVANMDISNGLAAVISTTGIPQLIKGGKVLKEVKSNQGGAAILSQIISGEKWICVIRSPKGDEVYLDGKKIQNIPVNTWFVPNILINYQSFFERTNPLFIKILTIDGRIFTIHEDYASIQEIFPPPIEANAVWQDGSRILVCERKETDVEIEVDVPIEPEKPKEEPAQEQEQQKDSEQVKEEKNPEESEKQEKEPKEEQSSKEAPQKESPPSAQQQKQPETNENQNPPKEEEKQPQTKKEKRIVKQEFFLYHSFTKNSYICCREYPLVFPSLFIKGFFISFNKEGVDAVDSLTGNASKLLEKPALKYFEIEKQLFILDNENHQYTLQDDGKILEIKEEKDRLNFGKLKPEEIIGIRRIEPNDLLFITDKRTAVFKNTETEIYEEKEHLLFYEVINENGCVYFPDSNETIDPNLPQITPNVYLLVMTNKTFYLYDIAEQMKRIRKMKIDDEPDEATIFEWGGLIMRSKSTVTILPLPDFTLSNLGTLKVSGKSKICLIKKQGLFVSEPDGTTMIYSNDHTLPMLYRENTPVIEEPVKKSFFGRVEKTPTQEKVDTSFGYSRPKNSIQQTTEIMQELLVTAQQRGEQLKEIEMKANRLLDHAREFHNATKKFRR